jgi:DNA-binding IclR family transcriptional regulator
VPHHCTAQGKVFLASGAAPLPAGPLESLAPRTIVDPATLADELERVRAQGYATTLDELEPGLWAVAAPVAGPNGVIAAISISGPATRLRDGMLDELGDLLVAETNALSTRLRSAEEGTTYPMRGAA